MKFCVVFWHLVFGNTLKWCSVRNWFWKHLGKWLRQPVCCFGNSSWAKRLSGPVSGLQSWDKQRGNPDNLSGELWWFSCVVDLFFWSLSANWVDSWNLRQCFEVNTFSCNSIAFENALSLNADTTISPIPVDGSRLHVGRLPQPFASWLEWFGNLYYNWRCDSHMDSHGLLKFKSIFMIYFWSQYKMYSYLVM